MFLDYWLPDLLSEDRLLGCLMDDRRLMLLMDDFLVGLMDDWFVQLMQHFLVLFMDHWLVDLSDFFLVDDWLDVLVDHILVVLMNNVLMVLMDYLLVMLVNYILMMLLYNRLIDMSLNTRSCCMRLDKSRSLVGLKHWFLLMSDHSCCLFVTLLYYGLHDFLHASFLGGLSEYQILMCPT